MRNERIIQSDAFEAAAPAGLVAGGLADGLIGALLGVAAAGLLAFALFSTTDGRYHRL